jgi:hypothetical protein
LLAFFDNRASVVVVVVVVVVAVGAMDMARGFLNYPKVDHPSRFGQSTGINRKMSCILVNFQVSWA